MNRLQATTPKLWPDRRPTMPSAPTRFTAGEIATALGGQKNGDGWMARCPAHDDRRPSLSIRDANGTVLVRCHAGCEQSAVLSALREQGLWDSSVRHTGHGRSTHQSMSSECSSGRTDAALQVWQRTVPSDGALVQRYLDQRGITIKIPGALRFDRGLRHPSGASFPAMVALVTDGRTGAPVAVHRTFLRSDGNGKAAVEPNRMMLGPCRGGAVRLGGAGSRVLVGEGIETCLAAMQAVGSPAWAALSTSGLRTLELPDTIREVVILADGDDPGEQAALQASARWTRQGRRVRIARAPVGCDFNDVLLGRAAGEKEHAQ